MGIEKKDGMMEDRGTRKSNNEKETKRTKKAKVEYIRRKRERKGKERSGNCSITMAKSATSRQKR